MRILLSFVAVAALAISVSSGVKAQSPPSKGAAKAGALHHHHHWQPMKHHYGKGMRAHWRELQDVRKLLTGNPEKSRLSWRPLSGVGRRFR